MPKADEGTVTADTETAAPVLPATEPLPGFMDALDGGWSEPKGVGSGHPEEATAVETSAKDKAPEVKADTPAAPAAGPDKTAETPDPAKTVNFDGFSDKQKTTFERLLKAGHVTPEEVEEYRKGFLRQDLFSKKTAVLARKTEEVDKSVAARSEDLKLLERIRNDDKLHAAWLRMSKGEVSTEESDEGFDAETSKKLDVALDKRIAQREREANDRTEREQAQYDAKKSALEAAVQETSDLLSISQEQLNGYMLALRPKVPQGKDPVLHFTPDVLQDQLALLHDAATARAEAAKLREQLGQRTSKAVQTSKQSLPPARRISDAPPEGLAKVMADLGVGQLTDVAGFGWGRDQQDRS